MQISGLSGDKAAAILEQYSTPHRYSDVRTGERSSYITPEHQTQPDFPSYVVVSLLTAYDQCASEAEKEKLLSSIRYGKLKRFVVMFF